MKILAIAALASFAASACHLTKSLTDDDGGGHPDGQSPAGQAERCGNGIDDNGDGQIDEGCPCTAGAAQKCYRGTTATRGVGTCHDGQQICTAAGRWGDCTGDTQPMPELCGSDGNGDGIDQDCTGAADNGCRCSATVNPAPRECPAGDAVGECKKGTQICGVDGKWSACEGAIAPQPEICGDGKDQDCNGVADDGCTTPSPDAGMAEVPPPACQDLTAPRLIAPLSTARVTRRDPVLHWELAAGTDGAHVELCKERACTTVLATFDATGTSGKPAGDLPAGVVYWRAWGKKGDATACQPGPPWEFFVNTRSAPVDASWGTVLDVNMDGYADLVLAAPVAFQSGDPSGLVYQGGPSGIGDTPSTMMSGGASGSAYAITADAGDVNGDGYADVVVLDNVGGMIFEGGPMGLATTPSVTFTPPKTMTSMGARSANSAGDVNGDGYADVIVGASELGEHAFIYLGSASGLSATPATTIDGSAFFGWSVATAGDVNADGYADVVVGSLTEDDVQVHLGSASGIPPTPSFTLPKPSSSGLQYEFGIGVAGGGDVNGDGYADVIVAEKFPPRVYVFNGSAAGVSLTPAVELNTAGPDPGGSSSAKATAMLTALDVNGDGYWDVVLSDADFDWVDVFLGSPAGATQASVVSLTNGSDHGVFGLSLTGADYDRDGFEDLGVGAPSAPSGADHQMGGPGRVYLFPGSAAGVVTTPADVLSGTGPNNGFGGSISLGASGS